jgi:hypothetical protein
MKRIKFELKSIPLSFFKKNAKPDTRLGSLSVCIDSRTFYTIKIAFKCNLTLSRLKVWLSKTRPRLQGDIAAIFRLGKNRGRDSVSAAASLCFASPTHGALRISMSFNTQTSLGLSALRDEPEPFLYSSTDSSSSSDSDHLPALTPRRSDESSSSSEDTIDSSSELPPVPLSSSSSDPSNQGGATKSPRKKKPKKKRQTRGKHNVPALSTSETTTIDTGRTQNASESITMTARGSDGESNGPRTLKPTTAQRRANHKRQKSVRCARERIRLVFVLARFFFFFFFFFLPKCKFSCQNFFAVWCRFCRCLY